MDYSDEAIKFVEEIVKTVEFYLARKRVFRIEVAKVEKGTATVHFCVRYYERQTLHKGSGGTISANPITGSSDFTFGFVMLCHG